MKRVIVSAVVSAVVVLASRTPAAAVLNVVASIPDLADVARHIGGDLVDVKSLATGVEDIHAVPMKPTFAVLMNRADVLLVLGLEAEHAFIPGLLEAARNPKIYRDAPGYVDCSVYVRPLEVPTRIDRSLGDQHPMGNPHYNLDPVRMKEAARAIAEGFARNDPEHEATYKRNLTTYLASLDAAIARWQQEAAPLKGKTLVSYHPDMIYFAERFGMESVGTIEIRAGIDPTPSHVEELEKMMREEKVNFVVRELHYPAGLAETVAQTTGATLVQLPAMSGGLPQTQDYISFIDYNLRTMLSALPGGA
jgi:ABC-type Zn uptake system ZnuABC Zn-binding protein ZnuA